VASCQMEIANYLTYWTKLLTLSSLICYWWTESSAPIRRCWMPEWWGWRRKDLYGHQNDWLGVEASIYWEVVVWGWWQDSTMGEDCWWICWPIWPIRMHARGWIAVWKIYGVLAKAFWNILINWKYVLNNHKLWQKLLRLCTNKIYKRIEWFTS